jgi:hypothetical protein
MSGEYLLLLLLEVENLLKIICSWLVAGSTPAPRYARTDNSAYLLIILEKLDLYSSEI